MPAFVALGGTADIECMLTNSNRSGLVSLRTESVSAKLVHLYGTRWTPAYFTWDPLQSAAGCVGPERNASAPMGPVRF
jgi:hypothetical protein